MNGIDQSVIVSCWNKTLFESFHIKEKNDSADQDPIDEEIEELSSLLKGFSNCFYK